MTRAENARVALYGLLDTHIAQIPQFSEDSVYASEFRKHLQLQVHHVDLGNTRSILRFGREISEKCVSTYTVLSVTLMWSRVGIPTFHI